MATIKITPATIDITMPMAVTNTINYTFKKNDGTPLDITTATLMFTAKTVAWDSNVSDSSAKIKKELIVTDGSNGKAKLFLSQTDTFIPVASYYYDIKIIQTYSGRDTTVDVALIGKLKITADRTNRVVGVA